MYRMEDFYPQSFHFRDHKKKMLILPMDSVGPNSSMYTFETVQSGVKAIPSPLQVGS